MFRHAPPLIRRALPGLVLGLTLTFPGFAEQLPIRIYRTADGLAQDNVQTIATDRNGYLWFGTNEGLSRFDGYEFTTYGVNDGLPNATVNAILAAHDGVLWVGTSRGLARFNPGTPASPRDRFAVYLPAPPGDTRDFSALAEDRDGSIWCGTRGGLLRLRHSTLQFERIDFGPTKPGQLHALLVDREGALWIGAQGGLYRRGSDAQLQQYTTRSGMPNFPTTDLVQDRHGRIWAAALHSLCLLVPHPDPNGNAVAEIHSFGETYLWKLLETSDGRLWIGTSHGLLEVMRSGATGGVTGLQNYGTANGLSDPTIETLAEDRDGNLWLGSETGGAMKIARGGIRTYTEADGLASMRLNSLFENDAGDLFAITGALTHKFLQHFDGRAFTAIPMHPNGDPHLGWGSKQIGFEDRAGEWWFATDHGLCRFPRVTRFEQLQSTRPKWIFTVRDGLTANGIFRVFEDSKGDVWMSTTDGQGADGLSRWKRSTNTLQHFSGEPGFGRDRMPSVFREDRFGGLWIGFFLGGVARYRDNHFLFLGPGEGITGGSVEDIFSDHAGRLWLGTHRGGLFRIDHPERDRPHATAYTTAQGLSSNDVVCINEDLFGRLYMGTGRGLDRLNPDGLIEHFSTADGFALGQPITAFRDRQGALWFGNLLGLSRWLPEAPQRDSPPPILIRGVRVRGVPQAISELGETAVQPFSLTPNQNQLQFDFVSIGFRPAEKRRYQYMLENADADWRSTESRTVNYASLPPGSYRFLVRAVDFSGALSSQPATASFTILAPYWQRWWFRLLALIAAASLLYAIYLRRLQGVTARVRLGYEERLHERTRIARELHDTLLQSLAGVSLQLDGVAKQIGPSSEEAADKVQVVRQQVDAAFREARQKVQDLRSPMLQGRVLPEVLLESLEQIAAGHSVHFQMTVAGEPYSLRESLDEMLLRIGQEAVANAARHAQASEIQVWLTYEGACVSLRVQDNGQGFTLEDARRREGHWGLRNMQERAQQAGAQWKITTAPGRGTQIETIVPTELKE